MIDKQLVADRIVSIRKGNKLTQVAFAKSLDISQQSLSQIENGIVLPSIEILQKLTSKYCIEYDFILDKNYRILDEQGGDPIDQKGGLQRGPHSEKGGSPLKPTNNRNYKPPESSECLLCKEKDNTIEALKQTIRAQETAIEALHAQIGHEEGQKRKIAG